ncbi:hypothetical protein [Mesorhizobium sp. BR-1-1-10]|uniref:hypothetical protein n=1 Tax=Mesorhizobium sp. BR-1-1-10 TaxID=2876660 RepID=UPI001CD0FBAB|nr:hypothetical protein [Mesorhizobium sp. BR-1-1-10]MBZ9974629.1 hypothetical protein [Mesorhizobium sp. BR-1-1-10]
MVQSARKSTEADVAIDDILFSQGSKYRHTDRKRSMQTAPVEAGQTSRLTETITSLGEVVQVDRRQRPATPQASMHAETSNRAKAVVSRVGAEFIILDCYLPSGNFLVQFPIALIDEDLRVFGQPVWISLGSEGGYRIPQITSRDIGPQPRLDGMESLEMWIDSGCP